MSQNILKKYNTQPDKPFVSKTVTKQHHNSRLHKLIKKTDRELDELIREHLCWHCAESKIFKLVWCHRCYFYVQNNFNDLEYE